MNQVSQDFVDNANDPKRLPLRVIGRRLVDPNKPEQRTIGLGDRVRVVRPQFGVFATGVVPGRVYTVTGVEDADGEIQIEVPGERLVHAWIFAKDVVLVEDFDEVDGQDVKEEGTDGIGYATRDYELLVGRRVILKSKDLCIYSGRVNYYNPVARALRLEGLSDTIIKTDHLTDIRFVD